jgi:hypothetical protein
MIVRNANCDDRSLPSARCTTDGRALALYRAQRAVRAVAVSKISNARVSVGSCCCSRRGTHDGGWLTKRVLPFVDRHSTSSQRGFVPLLAGAWTLLFVVCSLGTFLIGRGDSATREACEGSWGTSEENECADRATAAPVVSYSGILFPERGVFLFFGLPCVPLWFITILLSHRSLQKLADVAWSDKLIRERIRCSQGNTAVGDEAGAAIEVDVDGRESIGRRDESEVNPRRPIESESIPRRPPIVQLKRMETINAVAAPLLLLVVCVSIGDPYPGPAIHATSAFFFFLLGVYNVFLSQSAMGTVLSWTENSVDVDDVGVNSTNSVTTIGNCVEVDDVGVNRTNSLTAIGHTGEEDTYWHPSPAVRKGRQAKRYVLFGLFGTMVPVTAVWGVLTYEWNGRHSLQMLAPVQYLWILAMTIGNGACFAEVNEAETVSREIRETRGQEGGASDAVVNVRVE